MQRRFLLKLSALAPVAFFSSQFLGARTSLSTPRDVAAIATELNMLATTIHTEDDARRLVDFVADLFAQQLPHAWQSNSLRKRIALAEFAAVSDAGKRVSEARLAGAWNAYVDTIQAPAESKVTAAEMHNSRDALFTTARVSWNIGGRNFWAVPSIYATEPDGTLAPGCRAIESIRILWDLANMPDNLHAARERVKQGVLFSSQFPHPETYKPSSFSSSVHGEVRAQSNPIQLAQRQYSEAHGFKPFSNVVLKMLDAALE